MKKLFVILTMLLIVGCTIISCDSEENASSSEKYKTGTYLVNEDISSGLYKVTISKGFAGMAYIERSSGVSMSFDDIIANIILTGDGYVTIKDTDVAVKVQDATLTPVDLATYPKNIKTEVTDGIYLVGYDIAPGTYKVEITDTVSEMAYVERMSDASMDSDAIIANEIFQGQGYVTIKDGDFAIQVQGAKLTLHE